MEAEVQDFIGRLAEVLEVPSVVPGDDFRSVPMWSSLVAFAVMVMMEQQYGKQVSMGDIQGAKTVADLARLVGVNP